jgi:hypothetical protein
MYGRSVRIILVAFVAASLFSACGGSGGSSKGAVSQPGAAPPAAAAKDRDSCTLVTKQEVAAVLGQAVTDTSKTDNGICTYTAGDPQIGVLVLDNFATRDTFDSFLESGKVHGKTYPVSGIGDAAIYIDSSLEGFHYLSLYVLKNKLSFALVGLENVKGQEGKTQPLPSVRTLAMQAVSQLG